MIVTGLRQSMRGGVISIISFAVWMTATVGLQAKTPQNKKPTAAPTGRAKMAITPEDISSKQGALF